MNDLKKNTTTQPAPDIPVTALSDESGLTTQEIIQHSVIYSVSVWTYSDSARPT